MQLCCTSAAMLFFVVFVEIDLVFLSLTLNQLTPYGILSMHHYVIYFSSCTVSFPSALLHATTTDIVYTLVQFVLASISSKVKAGKKGELEDKAGGKHYYGKIMQFNIPSPLTLNFTIDQEKRLQSKRVSMTAVI